MDDINLRKRRKKRGAYLKLVIVVLLVFFLILIKASSNVYNKNVRAKENLEEIQKKFEDLKSREKNLSMEIEVLNTERGVDEEIRSKFRVAKEGEKIIFLINPPETSNNSEFDTEISFWSKVWKFLGF